MQTDQVRIIPYLAVRQMDGLETALDAVFFEASATKMFADEAARAAFRQRWLGRYLTQEAEHCFLALGENETLAGYLVGSLANPSDDASHADLPYRTAFESMLHDYPAHLHISVAPKYRSSGLGARLITDFCAHAAMHSSPGVHVITAKGVRNVGFYLANGFHQVAETRWNGRELLLLGRRIG